MVTSASDAKTDIIETFEAHWMLIVATMSDQRSPADFSILSVTLWAGYVGLEVYDHYLILKVYIKIH